MRREMHKYVCLFFLVPIIYFSNAINIAKGKDAILSDRFEKYGASNAVDGYTGTTNEDGFACSQTDNRQPLTWFAVDLGNIYSITKIDIYGRTDFPSLKHLIDFDVEVIMPLCPRYTDPWYKFDEGKVTNRYSYNSSESTQFISVEWQEYTVGRFVRVRKRTTDSLVICEIEVHGKLVRNPITGSHDIISSCRNLDTSFDGITLGTAVAKSRVQCVALCVQESECRTVSYKKRTDVCTMFSIPRDTADRVVHSDASAVVYFID